MELFFVSKNNKNPRLQRNSGHFQRVLHEDASSPRFSSFPLARSCPTAGIPLSLINKK